MNKPIMLVASLVCLACLLLGGCGPGKGRLGAKDLVVTVDDSLKEGGRLGQVQVDLVGIKPDEVEAWKAYGVSDYFSGNDAKRAGAAEYSRRLLFSSADQGPKTVSAKDEIWSKWDQAKGGRGVMSIAVLAYSSAMTPGSPGNDPRKRIFLFDSRVYTKADKVEFIIKKSGVESPTPAEQIPAQ